MSPGGHAVTTAAVCGAAWWLTRSLPGSEAFGLVGGLGAGGFFIDVDHAVDYLVFEPHPRELTVGAFLRHYLEARVKRAVLVLHSYELFVLLGLLAFWLDALSLWGYLFGALMHLGLDIARNGECRPRSIAAFYSFGYRLVHRFDADRMLGPAIELRAPRNVWAAVLRGAHPPVGEALQEPTSSTVIG